MILSGRDLNWYIETGKLKIEPVADEQFQQNGIDLILEDLLDPVTNQKPAAFTKGNFYLGSTRERLELPDDLMAFVELRSSWARKGLFLPPTIVDAGFQGNLTLEIVCHADNLAIPYGQRVPHLIFAKTSGPCVKYKGRYQNQSGITKSRIDI